MICLEKVRILLYCLLYWWMEKEQNNLLNFLKRASHFSTSSINAFGKKTLSQSRDKQSNSKQYILNSNRDKSSDFKPINIQKKVKYNTYNTQRSKTQQPLKQFFIITKQNNEKSSLANRNFYLEERQHTKQAKNPQQNLKHNAKINSQWKGVLSTNTSFQITRVESVQCIQSMSNKIRKEVVSINRKIDRFNSNLIKAVSSEFQNIKQQVYRMVEEVYNESSRYLQSYRKVQEDKFAWELIKLRDQLQKQFANVEKMRMEINSPQWRKIAGKIIADNLQHHIDQIINTSSAIEIDRWELGDLVGYRLIDMEKDLRECFKLINRQFK